MDEIPDLKKAAQERFVWAPGALLQGAASAPVGRASASALLARLRSTVLGRIAVLAVLVGVGFGLGVGVLGLSCLEIGDAQPAGRGGLGAITSRLRVRAGARDRLRYLRSKGEVFFAPFKGAKATEGAETVPGEAAEEAAPPEPGAVDVELNFDSPSADTRAGGAAGVGALSANTGGGSGKASSSREAAAPKFVESGGKLNVKAVKKGRAARTALAATGGRRGTAANKGDSGRAVAPGIAAARGAGTQAPVGAPKSGLDFLLGGSGAPGGAPALDSGSNPRSGGGAGGGPSPGGAGEGPEQGETEDPNAMLKALSTLMEKANEETEKAKDEMKKAQFLAAGGHLPQAHYHYARAEKAKRKAKEYSDRARVMTESISAQSQLPAPGGGQQGTAAPTNP